MPMNAYFRPKLKVAAMKPFDFFHLRPPEDALAYFPVLRIWTAILMPNGRWIFPTIEPPEPGVAAIKLIGLDYDGSVIGMVIDGPDIGKTIVAYPPMTDEGKVKKKSVH